MATASRLRSAVGLALCSLAILAAASSAIAAGGVIEINQAKILANGNFPYVISAAGSYRLSSNLTVAGTGVDAIDINGSFAPVTLDLNGFNITGPGSGSGKGIFSGGTTALIVSNGAIGDFGSNGVQVAGAATLKDVISGFNGGAGIVAGGGLNLEAASAVSNAGAGIVVGPTIGGSFTKAYAANNGSDGIQLLTGLYAVVTCDHCGSGLNGGNGINAGVNTSLIVKDSAFGGNTLNGIVAPDGSVIESTIAAYNHGYGILANAAILKSDQVIGNNAGNASGGILGFDAALNPLSVGNDSGCWNNWAGGNGSSPSVAQISGCAPAGANICPGGTACP